MVKLIQQYYNQFNIFFTFHKLDIAIQMEWPCISLDSYCFTMSLSYAPSLIHTR